MWNWKKINGIADLPEFDKEVMLFQEGSDLAVVGWLKSVDTSGAHWKLGRYNTYNGLLDFLSINNIFEPTYWCEIEIPVDEKV